jgi:hypothetical protein
MKPENVSSFHGKNEYIDHHPGLSLGTLLQVKFEGLGSSRSRLIGMEPGNFLIILTPPIANLASKLYQKNHGILRYLFSGRVYAFRSTLLSIIKEPYRLSILTYPTTIENVNLRKHERISSLIAAEMSVKGQVHEGIISDISNGGCSFEFNKSDQRTFPELKVLDEVVISMILKDPTSSTVFNAEARSIRRDNENMVVGIQFTPSDFKETDEKSAMELSDYLRTQQGNM